MEASGPVAIAIMAKVPVPGRVKTRLCPPLAPVEAAALAAAFLADVAGRVADLARRLGAVAHVAHAPAGEAVEMAACLPLPLPLIAQGEGDLGARMAGVVAALCARGHRGVVLLGTDAPTLPDAILAEAVRALDIPGRIAMAPVRDGGYGVLALDRPHPALFADMPWSTNQVAALTRTRARAAELELVELPGWYDVDDPPSLALLAAELAGHPPEVGHALPGVGAPRTAALLATLRARGFGSGGSALG
ncbi:TIGR04282 family arsenosugar biosynthesis glycosyltransferase [Blastochloris sulfoviridis]|uniref:Glycosyltransferase n=1 Tax=Blastochloris sulfoviridis TaxID=50712 RepID=A0A5M6HUE7_9HYPH|nr:TIGR04282 family arsenosugar biosynthesis glycosyltransferase [Blastochloris sulfoviridis]KAA5599543.1 glycosyltransferase [Blastochloris sulfoviridis]